MNELQEVISNNGDKNMNRFSCNENIKHDEMAFQQGVNARISGKQKSSNPYTNNHFLSRSWIAGWCDQDQTIMSEVNTQLRGRL